MKLAAIICLKCNDMLYLRTEYDTRQCECKHTTLAMAKGEFKVSCKDFRRATIMLPYDKKQLYEDYNEERDRLGVIRKPFSTDKKFHEVLIKTTKSLIEYNKKINHAAMLDLFEHQLSRLEQSHARLHSKSK